MLGEPGHGSGSRYFGHHRVRHKIADEYKQTFKVLRSLPCDVPLASHGAMYNMPDKFKRIGASPNPHIDPAGYKAELDVVEKVAWKAA